MSHFAKIDKNNTVTQVIVAEQDFIDGIQELTLISEAVIDEKHNEDDTITRVIVKPAVYKSDWIQTSYNTHGGVHYGQDGEADGGVALRKNYASIGYTYDEDKDVFIPSKPYASWILNEDSCLWEAPVARPDDDKVYSWDEDSKAWVEQSK